MGDGAPSEDRVVIAAWSRLDEPVHHTTVGGEDAGQIASAADDRFGEGRGGGQHGLAEQVVVELGVLGDEGQPSDQQSLVEQRKRGELGSTLESGGGEGRWT